MPEVQWRSRRIQFIWHAYAVTLALVAVLLVSREVQPSYLARNALGIGFFLILETFAEVLYVPLPQGGGVSVGFGIALACNILFGPSVAALVSGIGLGLAIIITGWIGFGRFLFNISQMALSTFTSGAVFRLAGGSLATATILQNGLALVASSITFFLLNATFVTLAISWVSEQSFRSVWAGNVKWNISSYFALVPLGLLIAMVYRSYGVPGSMLLVIPLLFARYSFLQYLNARKASLSVTQALAAALEAKDAYTKGHSDRVAALAVKVAKELALAEEQIQVIRWAAEMHDIGKIGVSENLLNKPGALTDSELEEVRKHALIGANMLQHIDFLRDVAHIIQYHHEWFDGSNGYPRQLAGESIPLGARILMVCDSFDAMNSDRPYRQKIGVPEAIRRLMVGRGSQFDPEVVEALLKVLDSQRGREVDEG